MTSNLIDPGTARHFERLPPSDLRAERSVLASLMLCGDDRATFEQTRAGLAAGAFYPADHAVIFQALCDLADRRTAIDSTTLVHEMNRRQVLEEVGGIEYVGQILGSCPSAAHGPHYATIVREKARLRALLSLCNDTIRSIYSPADDDVAESIGMGLAAKAARVATTGKPNQVHRLGDVAHEVYEAKGAGNPQRIPTGLRDLDRLIGGLRRGGKTIVGAKPGMGKSTLLKQIGLNLSRGGVTFGVISVEESRQKIAENALSNESGVLNNRIAFGRLEPDEWTRLAQATGELARLPFLIIDSARRLSNILAAVRILHAEHGCQVIAVDHLHLVDGETDEHREREVSKISAELKWVWKDLNVAGIEAAQLNRGGGRDRPTLASLRDSGSLEQDADTVILLHREDYYRDAKSKVPPDYVLEAIVAKNKDGATCTVPLNYDGARQRISDRNGGAEPGDGCDPYGEPAAA